MSDFIAALPMYDWPEVRAETDAQWAELRDRLRAVGVGAPEVLARRNADMPPVPGGIRDAAGLVVAPDPATLPPDEFDLPTLWRHPALLFAQSCWGPMEMGLTGVVQVIGQPSYSEYEGGEGELYSSAVLMRGDDVAPLGESRLTLPPSGLPAPANRHATLPLDLLRGKRFAYNNPDSMSGMLGLQRDLETAGESLAIFSERLETGSHRASISAVAEGRADVCAIDCRSWHLAQRFEPAAQRLTPIGWTARRKGLPYITARSTPADVLVRLREAL